MGRVSDDDLIDAYMRCCDVGAECQQLLTYFLACDCRFVADNAWNIAEVGFGVTGLILAGLAVGRYMTLLVQLVPFHRDDACGRALPLPVISLRETTPPTTSRLP